LDRNAQCFPYRPAIKDRGKWYHYSCIKELSDSFARVLKDYSIQPGDRILLLCGNSIDYVVSYFGALKAGATVVPIPIDVNARELRNISLDCDPTAIIFQPQFHQIIDGLHSNNFDESPLIFCVKKPGDAKSKDILILQELTESLRHNESIEHNRIRSKDIALILYTSGSTGKPKGVCLTHKNVTSNVEAVCQYLKLTYTDVMMQVLPFYYSYGKSFLHALIKSGGSIVINNNFTYCNLVLEEMEVEKCTGFAGVPSTFHILLNHSKWCEYNFENMRFVTQAGGHMQVKQRKELLDCLPSHVELFIMYGQTEATARLTYLPPKKIHEKIASVGKPLANVTLIIKDRLGNTCPPNEIGELWAKGPNVMAKYWNNKEETQKVLDAGYLRTGDLGYMDEDGYFYITGRLRKMIKSGGYRVNSKEIETTILEHDGVQDVFVIGVPDEKMGEAIQAVVVLKAQKNIAPVIKFCKRKLPFYKTPKHFIAVDQVPRKASGKIDLEKIRSLHNASME
jgi:acyl-CoA synthetase (AMP-forming)/AMP-acid ligase II